MAKQKSTTPTDREWAFLAEYQANGFNGTQAFLTIVPGSTHENARRQAAKILSKDYIRTRLKRIRAEAERKIGVNAERVLREWATLAFSDVGEVVDLEAMKIRQRMAPTARRAISSVRVRKTTTTNLRGGKKEVAAIDLKLHGKADALDKLSRHLGLYKDLPPLETILALLPPVMAATVRAELARAVPPAGGASGAHPGGGPDDGRPPVGADCRGVEGGGGDPEEPVEPVRSDEVEPGPVAAGVPGDDWPADAAPVLPPGGEVGDVGGSDLGPLFDAP
jgi:phage terminase small subunit